MDDAKITEEFKRVLQEQLDKELDSRETFPPAIQEQIKETYKKLWAQKLAWLKEHEKKEELP